MPKLQSPLPDEIVKPTRGKAIRQVMGVQDAVYELTQKLRSQAPLGTKEERIAIGETLAKLAKAWKELDCHKRKIRKYGSKSKSKTPGEPRVKRNGSPNGSAAPAGRKRVKSPALEPVYDVQPPLVVVPEDVNPDAELDPLE